MATNAFQFLSKSCSSLCTAKTTDAPCFNSNIRRKKDTLPGGLNSEDEKLFIVKWILGPLAMDKKTKYTQW